MATAIALITGSILRKQKNKKIRHKASHMTSINDPGTEHSISRKRSTIWNFVFLNVGFLITLCNGLLIIPLYLHYINASMYGAWLATGNILTWITIIDPGVAGVLLQRVSFYIGERNKEQVGLAITSGILISSVLFVFALLLGYGLSFFVTGIARIDKAYAGDILSAFRIAMWGTALSLLADTFRNVILGFQKTRQHGIMLYSVQIAGILLNVVLLIMHTGVYALAYASLFKGFFTLVFAVIYSIILLRQNRVRLRFDGRYFLSFSRIFAFTFSSSLFETVANNIDLILVSRYLGSQSVTVLDLCRRPVRMVCSLANNITISMLPSLPHLFGSGDRAKIKRTVVRVWNAIFWVSGFMIGGFMIYNHSFVSNWVGSRFWIGNSNSVIICFSIFLWTIGFNLSNITLSMGDIRNNSIVTIVRSIVYIAALYLLVRFAGMTGAVIAFLIPAVIMTIYYPQKLIRATLDPELRHTVLTESGLVALILIVCSAIAFLFNIKLGWIGLAVCGALYGLVFIAILTLFSTSFKKELRFIISGVKSKLGLGGSYLTAEKQTT
jgi:O-antigen/teichoic acid export membrane protein